MLVLAMTLRRRANSGGLNDSVPLARFPGGKGGYTNLIFRKS